MTQTVLSPDARIAVDGLALEVRRWPGGRGAPVVMLHEGLGSVAMWRDFPARLAEATGREVIAWSRRGYGRSDPLPHRRTPRYMHDEATAARRLLERLGLERAHLFGHSDGGSIALILAALAPEVASSLVLEAPHVIVEPQTYDSIAAVKAGLSASGLIGRLARHHDRPEEVFWRWNDIWLDPDFRAWDITGLLPAVTAPALLIQGHDDEYGTMAQLDLIGAALPETARLELAACGHAPHRDQPEAVLRATAEFLAERP
jgi:pimeloyl-ACP methyl ester carboxylesterase